MKAAVNTIITTRTSSAALIRRCRSIGKLERASAREHCGESQRQCEDVNGGEQRADNHAPKCSRKEDTFVGVERRAVGCFIPALQ